jgi:hypothetical protein
MSKRGPLDAFFKPVATSNKKAKALGDAKLTKVGWGRGWNGFQMERLPVMIWPTFLHAQPALLARCQQWTC